MIVSQKISIALHRILLDFMIILLPKFNTFYFFRVFLAGVVWNFFSVSQQLLLSLSINFDLKCFGMILLWLFGIENFAVNSCLSQSVIWLAFKKRLFHNLKICLKVLHRMFSIHIFALFLLQKVYFYNKSGAGRC